MKIKRKRGGHTAKNGRRTKNWRVLHCIGPINYAHIKLECVKVAIRCASNRPINALQCNLCTHFHFSKKKNLPIYELKWAIN